MRRIPPACVWALAAVSVGAGACNASRASGTSGDVETSSGVGESEGETGAASSGGSTSPDPEPDVATECEHVCPDGTCVDGWGSQFAGDDEDPCCGHGVECEETSVSCSSFDLDCPEGEKCTAYSTFGGAWDLNKCVEVEGDGQPGDPCIATDGNHLSGHDDCAAGSLCWDFDPDTDVGWCVGFCEGTLDDPSCSPGLECGIFNAGVLPICVPGCHPLLAGADCPHDDNLCLYSTGGFVCILDASGGMGTPGAECGWANSCNQGLYCADAGIVAGCTDSQCCTPFCDLTQPNTCPGANQGEECVPWFEQGMAPPGYENVGACAIPP